MNDDKVTLNGLFDGFYRAINGFAPLRMAAPPG